MHINSHSCANVSKSFPTQVGTLTDSERFECSKSANKLHNQSQHCLAGLSHISDLIINAVPLKYMNAIYIIQTTSMTNELEVLASLSTNWPETERAC